MYEMREGFLRFLISKDNGILCGFGNARGCAKPTSASRFRVRKQNFMPAKLSCNRAWTPFIFSARAAWPMIIPWLIWFWTQWRDACFPARLKFRKTSSPHCSAPEKVIKENRLLTVRDSDVCYTKVQTAVNDSGIVFPLKDNFADFFPGFELTLIRE